MYKEQVCLNDVLCLKNQEFVAVNNIIGGEDFEANGVLGLGPTLGTQSYISNLMKMGKMDKGRVGIDLQRGKVSFGHWDMKYVKLMKGQDGVLWYPNVGVNYWSMFVTALGYGGETLKGEKGTGSVK